MPPSTLRCSAIILLSTTIAQAQWPQFGGPNRDFTVAEDRLDVTWPKDGPKRIWSRPLGDGYSSILVDDGHLFTMYRDGDEEIIAALDSATGRSVWQHRYAAPVDAAEFASRYGHGPRSTPLIAGDRIFAIGFNGRLTCLDKKTGTAQWTVDLTGKFDAKLPRWGYANSPIAFENNIIVPVGGKGAALVALDQSTGRVVWKRHDFENSYGSPVLIDAEGERQLVCLMAREIVAVNPANGDLLWQHPHEGQWLNNIPNPIWGADQLLFVTSEGNAGSRVLKLSKQDNKAAAKEIWSTRIFRVVHRNVLRIGDMILGSSGDFGATVFTAIDIHTGEALWKRRDIDRAGMLRVGDKLLMLEETGRLSCATPTRDGLTIHAQSTILEEKAWTIPTLVENRLYVRNRQTIAAFELAICGSSETAPPK